jgi:hypothetical protein
MEGRTRALRQSLQIHLLQQKVMAARDAPGVVGGAVVAVDRDAAERRLEGPKLLRRPLRKIRQAPTRRRKARTPRQKLANRKRLAVDAVAHALRAAERDVEALQVKPSRSTLSRLRTTSSRP